MIAIDSGTKTTDGTEQTLYTSSTARVTQLIINMDNSTSTETIVIREKQKVLSGGSAVLVEKTTLVGADGGLPNGALVFQTNPMAGAYGVTYTIEKTAGTNRNYDWRVDEL